MGHIIYTSIMKNTKLSLNLGSPIVVFDTETGGLNEVNEIEWDITKELSCKSGDEVKGIVKKVYAPILEIAASKVDPFSFKEVDSFYSLCGPEKNETINDLLNRCEQEALDINGLDKRLDELEKAPSLSEVMQKFKDWATKESKYFIPSGQNVRFDINMVNATFKRYGINYQIFQTPLELRTLSLVYFALPDTPVVANYKLTTVSEALGISTEGAHEALEDVRMTSECIKIILRKFTIHD